MTPDSPAAGGAAELPGGGPREGPQRPQGRGGRRGEPDRGGAPAKQLVDAFSRGSRNHDDQCMPCRHNLTGSPCPQGRLCNCCHYSHGPEKFLAMRLHGFLRESNDQFSRVATALPAHQRARLCSVAARAWLGSPQPLAATASGGAGQEVRAVAAGLAEAVPAEAVAQVSTSLPLTAPPLVLAEAMPSPLPLLPSSFGHLTSEQLVLMLEEAMPERYED
ncbi:unnamed protein product [Prorocentrum cordatum]|uniref:C3H1-type domain-containing protein n=1 Tax=Prorocentrum cordatum TaxID=2364126 RepID=A0ABN9UR69_9DINO|nr:unnamed protein product [Polarella glacialis]